MNYDLNIRENRTKVKSELDDPISSKYLYVGGTRDLAKRFKAHLGYGHFKIYAKHLAYWCSEEIQIDFCCIRFSDKTNAGVIQSFEDGLWEVLKPMFGGKGAK